MMANDGRASMPDSLEGLVIKDAHLERVLQGLDFLVQDGAMGTMLQKQGLTAHGELPDLLNFTNPDAITAVHASYVEAGAEMVTTNTFSANAHKLEGRAEVADAAAACRACRGRTLRGPEGWARSAFLLEPRHAVVFRCLRYVLRTGASDRGGWVRHRADKETMTDLREAKAALLALKEYSGLFRIRFR